MKKFPSLGVVAFASFAAAGLASSPAAHAQTVGAEPFFNNTIYCQNQANLNTCTLWLNSDGSYQVFYNRGVQKTVPQSAGGPFQYEGREGTYSTKIVGAATQACLKPDTSTAFTYNTEKAGELYAGTGCYDLPALAVGASQIVKEPGGKTYKLWLLSGR